MLAAIQSAGRDEFFMVGGAGSANVMRDIKADNTVLKATVIYPSTQSASGGAVGPTVGAGQGNGRPQGTGGPQEHHPVFSGRHQGQRRHVPAAGIRILIGRHCWCGAGGTRRRSAGEMMDRPGKPGLAGRHDRVRLHGQGALVRMAHGLPDLRPATRSADGGARRPQRVRRAARRRGTRVGRGRDRLAHAARSGRHRSDRHLHPGRLACRDRRRCAERGQARAVREATGQHGGRGRGHGGRGRGGRPRAPRPWWASTIGGCRPPGSPAT